MHKLIASLFFFLPILAMSEEMLTYQYVDSVSYHHYLEGDWDKVIQVGKEALRNDIDFKYLQQRMGYACFQKSNYYEAIRYYENALAYDQSDEGTILYLYYSGLNIGDKAFARFYAGKLSEETKNYLSEKAFKPVSTVDLEFNKKWNSEGTRSDPNYQRIGLNTNIGYRFNLYQSVSTYNQSASYDDGYNEYRSKIKQDEYYALVSGSFNSNLGIDVGYHFVNSKFDTETWDLTLNEMTDQTDTLKYPGHLFFGNFHYKWYRFNLGLSASLYDTEFNRSEQLGFHLGIGLPGKHTVYLKNSLFLLNDDYYNWTVSSHSIGCLLFHRFWLEGALTLGNLTNFVDMNGLYIYNSFDPTLSRVGFTLFWYMNRQLNVFTNFTSDKKQNSFLLNDYQQLSISGGIIWKL